MLDTVSVTVQLPLTGIIAPVSVAVPVVVANDRAAPLQVVLAAGDVAMLSELGNVSVRLV